MELGNTQVTTQPKKQVVCYQCGKLGHFSRDGCVCLSDGGTPMPGHAQVNHVITEQLLPPPVESIADSSKN